MPLPEPAVPRTAQHRRTITVQAYRRDDGLWDLEGHLTDVWPHPVPCAGGLLPGGQPMHDMWLRYTVDKTALIVAVQAVTDAGPYGAACGTIAPDYAQLVGVRIAKGYREAVRQLFARTAGCTHMNELAGAMGSAAMQAMWEEFFDPESDQKPFSIDGCHALKSSGPQVATFFPRWHRPEGQDG